MITKDQLRQIMPQATAENLEKFCQPLNDAMQEYKINTPARQRAFLANVAVESAQLSTTVENLNYSAEGLLKIFPTHFTSEEALIYARQPEKIANRAYANRLGNGDEASGDGWKYRGTGLLQATGKTLQEILATVIGCSTDNLALPLFAAKGAGYTWKSKGCNEISDLPDNTVLLITIGKHKPVEINPFGKTCVLINGGFNGYSERKAFLETAKKVLL